MNIPKTKAQVRRKMVAAPPKACSRMEGIAFHKTQACKNPIFSNLTKDYGSQNYRCILSSLIKAQTFCLGDISMSILRKP